MYYSQRKNLLISTVLLFFLTNNHEVVSGAKFQVHQEVESTQGKLIEHTIVGNEKLIVRLPSNTLLKYTSYKDVSILHFRIPADSRTAFFTFKAFEEPKSAFQRKCKSRDVTLHLKSSTYPVISPENITFPKNFLNTNQRFKIYDLQFQSDGVKQSITIPGPQIGSWFAIAFVSWTDPINDRIEQQGLSASCETLLMADLTVSQFEPIILNNEQIHKSILIGEINKLNGNTTASNKYAHNEEIYKFYVWPNVGTATARISIIKACFLCPDISFRVKANAFPDTVTTDHSINIYNVIIKPNQTGEITTTFFVQPNTWHYAVLAFVNNTHTHTTHSDKDLKSLSEKWLSSQRYRRHQISLGNNETLFSLKYSLQIIFEGTSEASEKYDETSRVDPNADTSDSINSSAWRPVRFQNIEFYPLLRQTYREFFTFDYDLVPDENGTVPTVLNLTAGITSGLSFEIGEVYDIGGTLSFAVSMKHSSKGSHNLKNSPSMTTESEQNGILADMLIGNPKKTEVNESDNSLSRSNQTIIVCMHFGEPGIPTWPDKCRVGPKILPASSIVNNTDSNTSTGLIHIPFPESGQWYVTMGLYCHGAETAARITIIDSVKEFVKKYANELDDVGPPCACANDAKSYKSCISDQKCLMSLNETVTLKIKECLMDSKCTSNYRDMTRNFEIHHKLATEQHFALDNCNTSVVFSVSSSPCVAGRCGRFGRCYHYMSGGFVFSTCVCMKGYRGWDCTEDSQVPSSMSILVALLLLTLSNLLFFPSIYMAVHRKYYTEAVIYFFAMLFSIFYHACDSGEDEYSFCLVKIGVLQFCDFYCGLLAIWVTLVAMSHIRQQLVSLLHMFGAILLAFGTELNKQSLWVFLAPALTGICIISASWGLRCYKSRKWFPAKTYLTVYMPLGMVLVMVGLVCYAFLQTKQNYHIVHSIWHMLMALSILCLLPSRKFFIPKC